MRIPIVAGLAILVLPSIVLAGSKLKLEEVPEFQLRARVVSLGGQATEGKKFAFALAGVNATAEGSGWSTPIKFGQPQALATLKGYPAIYMSGWPLVLRLTMQDVVNPTLVEAELNFTKSAPIPVQPQLTEGGPGNDPKLTPLAAAEAMPSVQDLDVRWAGAVKLSGELFGPSLGIVVWRDEQQRPHAATMADYNHRRNSLACSMARSERTTGLNKNSSTSMQYWSKCSVRLPALSRWQPTSWRRASSGASLSKYFKPVTSPSRTSSRFLPAMPEIMRA